MTTAAPSGLDHGLRRMIGRDPDESHRRRRRLCDPASLNARAVAPCRPPRSRESASPLAYASLIAVMQVG